MLKRYLSQFSQTRFYRKNARLMATVTLFVWCWMLMYGFLFYQPKYTAESMVLIKDSAITSSYIEPEQLYSSKTTSSSAANPVLNTMGLLHSSAIANALWEYFEEKHPEELKKRGIKTRKDWLHFFKDGKSFIKAKNKPGTDLITLKFKWTDPKISKEGSDVIIAAFQQASLDINQAEQKKRSQYLKSQVADVKSQLEAVRKDKSDYKRKMKTVDATKQSHEMTKMRTSFESRLDKTLARAEGTRAKLSEYQQMLGMTSEQAIEASAIGMNSTLTNLKNELYTLSQTHAFLSTTLTDKNPKVREIRAKMEQVENDIRDELLLTLGYESDIHMKLSVSDATRSKMVNDMVATQAELIRLNQEARGLKTRLKEINEKIAAFPTIEEALNNIEQQEHSLSDSLDALRKKYTEAQLKEAQTLSNVFVVDPPQLPKNANFPAPLHLIVLGFMAGIGAGIAVVVVRYKYKLDEKRQVWVEKTIDILEEKESQVVSYFDSEGIDIRKSDDPLDHIFMSESSKTTIKQSTQLDELAHALKQKQTELRRYHQALSEREQLIVQQNGSSTKKPQAPSAPPNQSLTIKEQLIQKLKAHNKQKQIEAAASDIMSASINDSKTKNQILARYLDYKNKQRQKKKQDNNSSNQKNPYPSLLHVNLSNFL